MGKNILGMHPQTNHPLGIGLTAVDTETESGVDQRKLTENDHNEEFKIFCIESLKKHHASTSTRERYRKRLEIYESLNTDISKCPRSLYPTDDIAKKGNFAEILLAEYIVATAPLQVPIYRLRYNPNPNQSMKGDDVLAFDLDADPVRIIVGEAKFRKHPQKQAVIDMVDGLTKSNKAGIPISLQFVADRLFETGQTELAEKVLNCELLFLKNQLRIDYVGLLMSDNSVHNHVNIHTKNEIHNLLMISVAFDSPEDFVQHSYADLEGNI